MRIPASTQHIKIVDRKLDLLNDTTTTQTADKCSIMPAARSISSKGHRNCSSITKHGRMLACELHLVLSVGFSQCLCFNN